MAWTCTPDITTDDATGDVVTGFSVNSDRQGVLDNKGQVVGMDGDYYEDEYGQTHHHFEDVEITDDYDADEYNDSEYIAALHESVPGLAEAVEWCAEGFTADEAEWYNEMIDSDDPDDLHEAIDYLLTKWMEAALDEEMEADANEEGEDIDESEWSTEQSEQLVAVSESLMATEPGGYEQAEYWQEFCDSAAAAGDEVLAGVAAATACFHDGEITAEEAIEYVIQNFPPNEVERAWNYINR